MPKTVTIPCDCCEQEPTTQCYEVTGWSAKTLGTPGCSTVVELDIRNRYIQTPLGQGPTPDQVEGALDGAFSVDCSEEQSGFCRDRLKSGLYPWGDAVYEGSSGSGEGEFSYSYLFEDCDLGEADLSVTISLRYLGPGDCPV
jgi:hypothetical protein